MKSALIFSILVVCLCNFQYVENCLTQQTEPTTTMVSTTMATTKTPSTMMEMMEMTTHKQTTEPDSMEPPKTYKALAVIHGSYMDSSISGLVQFTQTGNEPIYVKGNITGLPTRPLPALHGFHIHARTIVSTARDASRCGSTLGHFNPLGVNHGNLGAEVSHKGDYGNVISSETGVIDISIMDHVNHLFGPKGIVGRTVVLHARADDLGQGGNAASLANGNAGSRIACGVIGAL